MEAPPWSKRVDLVSRFGTNHTRCQAPERHPCHLQAVHLPGRREGGRLGGTISASVIMLATLMSGQWRAGPPQRLALSSSILVWAKRVAESCTRNVSTLRKPRRHIVRATISSNDDSTTS